MMVSGSEWVSISCLRMLMRSRYPRSIRIHSSLDSFMIPGEYQLIRRPNARKDGTVTHGYVRLGFEWAIVDWRDEGVVKVGERGYLRRSFFRGWIGGRFDEGARVWDTKGEEAEAPEEAGEADGQDDKQEWLCVAHYAVFLCRGIGVARRERIEYWEC
jgi:hypothetical protein